MPTCVKHATHHICLGVFHIVYIKGSVMEDDNIVQLVNPGKSCRNTSNIYLPHAYKNMSSYLPRMSETSVSFFSCCSEC